MLAYAGELDPQKQSSEIMEQASAAEGVKIERRLGPKTEHKYEPVVKKKIAQWLDERLAVGRAEMPRKVRFTTYTLRYPTMKWITLDALERHWERADIEAELMADKSVEVTTKNVTAFTLNLPATVSATVDGQGVAFRRTEAMPSMSFKKSADGIWGAPFSSADAGMVKRPGVTGPVDDAFVDAFLFVRPTGRPLNAKLGEWTQSEMERAITEWRRVLRGEVRVKDDTALTAEDVANANLILWGDSSSNSALGKLLARLPLKWTAQRLTLGALTVSAADHAPILIYLNPANPKRYIVLNSGFTFREGSTTTNSLQTPKLPAWAVIDLRTPANAKWPGLVVDAGFFDEAWQWPRK